MTKQKVFRKRQPCIVKACNKPAMGRGLCSMHYSRLRRHGDVQAAGRPLRILEPAIMSRSRAKLAASRRTAASRAKTRQRSLEQWERLSAEERQQRTAAMHAAPTRQAKVTAARQTPASRAKTARASQAMWDGMDPTVRQRRVRKMLTARPSSLEIAVAAVLDALGVVYESQRRIGRYYVDFYVPAKRLVIECDGLYWHSQRTAHDGKRDAFLRREGYPVLRLSEQSIRTGSYLATLKAVV